MGLSRTKDRPFKRSVMEALARSEASGSWKKTAHLTIGNAPVYKELQRGTKDNYLHCCFRRRRVGFARAQTT
jgi:hypothetical protein